MDEQELAIRCHRGDNAARRELYETYGARLLSLCRRYAVDKADAEDLMQDAFVKIFRVIGRFRWTRPGSLYSWMARVALNLAFDSARRRKRLARELVDVDTLKGEVADEPDYEQTLSVPSDVLKEMVAALPEWLRTRLKTFNVVSGVGGGSSETETVPNNKLALRAQVEVSGQASYSAPGEGSQVARYAYPDTRSKTKGRSGLSTNWFLRSPSVSGNNTCCYVSSGGSVSTYYPSSEYGLAPFGCV